MVDFIFMGLLKMQGTWSKGELQDKKILAQGKIWTTKPLLTKQPSIELFEF